MFFFCILPTCLTHSWPDYNGRSILDSILKAFILWLYIVVVVNKVFVVLFLLNKYLIIVTKARRKSIFLFSIYINYLPHIYKDCCVFFCSGKKSVLCYLFLFDAGFQIFKFEYFVVAAVADDDAAAVVTPTALKHSFGMQHQHLATLLFKLIHKILVKDKVYF